jgi:hypothetical protein
MKIEVTNAPGDLRELVTRATGQKDFLVDLATGRTAAKDCPDQSINLLETYLDLLQVCDGLQFDIDRAITHAPFHPERAELLHTKND